MDRSIASRPSFEQVVAIVDFMENHPALGLGQMRGMEAREESKKLWLKLTRIVNNITGPTRPMKSWMKYWADKKSTVRSKVFSGGGDANNLCSNIEKKIFDLFLTEDTGKNEPREPREPRDRVKQEAHFLDESLFEEGVEQSDEPPAFEETVLVESGDPEDRQTAIMEKLVKVMSEQAAALSQLAHAAELNAHAMDQLAEASHIQARAVERLANTFETIGAASRDVRTAVADIDNTMKRFYNTAPT